MNDKLSAWALEQLMEFHEAVKEREELLEEAQELLADAAEEIEKAQQDVKFWRKAAEDRDEGNADALHEFNQTVASLTQDRDKWKFRAEQALEDLSHLVEEKAGGYASDDHQDAEVTQWSAEAHTLADLENAPDGTKLGPDNDTDTLIKDGSLWHWNEVGDYGSPLEVCLRDFAGDWTRSPLKFPNN